MFKKFIALTLAAALFGSTVYAAEPSDSYDPTSYKGGEAELSVTILYPRTVTPRLRHSIEVHLNEYESLSDDDTFELPLNFFPRGPWDREHREFDNITDQMFFNQFGGSFEFMQRNSIEHDQVITYGDLRMELFSSVAVAGPQVNPFFWGWSDGEDVFNELLAMTRQVEIFTFFSLTDESGELDLAGWGTVLNLYLPERTLPDFILPEVTLPELTPELDEEAGFFAISPILWGHISFLYTDPESGKNIFVIRHNATVSDDAESVSLEFTIDRILTNQQSSAGLIDIDLAYLLDTHEATFLIEDAEGRGGGTSFEMFEIMGDDFNPFAPDVENMKRDELHIPIDDERFISNIAIRDNFLHLQIAELQDWGRTWPIENWSFLSLMDSRVDEDELMWGIGTLHPIYNLDLSRFDNEGRFVDGLRYDEQVFHLEDLEIVDYLTLRVENWYYAVVMPVDLSVSAFDVPINKVYIEFEEGAEAEIMGDIFVIKDVVVTPLEISFVIEDGGILQLGEEARGPGHHFSPTANMQVVIINRDGEERYFFAGGAGWGAGAFFNMDVTLQSGDVIDMENIAAIRINGALFEVD